MSFARLGNTAVREVIGADPDGTPIHRRYTGTSTTVITFPGDEDGWTHDERVATATSADGHWAAHSSRPPAWVQSDDPVLEADLAAHWGCPVGEPAGWTNHIEAV